MLKMSSYFRLYILGVVGVVDGGGSGVVVVVDGGGGSGVVEA